MGKAGFVLESFCRVYMRLRPELSIRHSEMAVLEILCTALGPHTPMGLAETLGVSRPMVASILSVLQNDGYVARISAPDDGRSVYVLPTKKGKNLVEKTNRELEKIHAQLSKKMGEKKFESFIKLASLANKILSDNKTFD